jgi:hypothetical protein
MSGSMSRAIVRSELERMALEYKQLADCQERQWPEADE